VGIFDKLLSDANAQRICVKDVASEDYVKQLKNLPPARALIQNESEKSEQVKANCGALLPSKEVPSSRTTKKSAVLHDRFHRCWWLGLYQEVYGSHQSPSVTGTPKVSSLTLRILAA
jgi:hypothetical protein